jgi:hypothetical protein
MNSSNADKDIPDDWIGDRDFEESDDEREEKEEEENELLTGLASLGTTVTEDSLSADEPAPELKTVSLSSATALFFWILRAPTLDEVNLR